MAVTRLNRYCTDDARSAGIEVAVLYELVRKKQIEISKQVGKVSKFMVSLDYLGELLGVKAKDAKGIMNKAKDARMVYFERVGGVNIYALTVGSDKIKSALMDVMK